jgi:asparagine synthase (glutamine-hydrolysing)
MCGILVVVAKRDALEPSACRRALATMHWRGPDFTFSRVWEQRVFLGQTVLSITGEPRDLAGQHQRSPSGRYELLYNGEVYNFQELEARLLRPRGLSVRSDTDTEVLAALHERLAPEEIPAQLDGMYAYAALDTVGRRLHFARDPQGEKSLYLYEDERRIVAASELRAILAVAHDVAIDPQALRDYFRTRHLMLFERTIFEGVRQLAPGTVETLDLTSLAWSRREAVSLRDWIDPGRLEAQRGRSLDDLAEELDGLLAQAVREMLPRTRGYAAVVSGGVDSSVIASHVVEQGNPTALVAVNHIGKDRLSADLSGFAQALGRPIDVVALDPATYAAEIWRCQQSCGQPLHSHSFVGQSVQSARVRAAGCRVLFGGDGADELFGGYEAYLRAPAVLGRFSPSPYTAHDEPRLAFVDDRPEWLKERLADAWAEALEAYAWIADAGERISLAMMYCDAAHQLPAVGLRGGDLMSMMWSVETRSVYLRRAIVAFALNLPGAAKLQAEGGRPQAKAVLKRVFLRRFPARLLAEKQGFAGFPNESATFLGDPHDYLALHLLGVHPESLPSAWADRATAWKLINVEYFLRYSGLAGSGVARAAGVLT